MPKLNFTVKGLQSLQPPQSGRIEYWDECMGGSFGLRISHTGQRTWVAMYRAGARKRRYTIGDFDRLPLADARELAKEILYQAAKGNDPAAEKAALRKAETFNELADLYIERHAKVEKRSWLEDERLLKKDVKPHWGSRKACEIRRKDVLALLDFHVARGAPVLANRILALVRKIFNFGIERDLLEFNPCQAVKKPTKEKAGQRVLTFDEIRTFWNALDASPHREAAAILKLRLLSAQRGSEIRLMQWSELDLETGWWTIPGERTKNKLAHRVPITEQAQQVLATFESNRTVSPFVFASPVDKSAAVFNVKDPFDEIRTVSGVAHFVPRDLRRTAASHMAGELGISRFAIGKILNHVEPGVTKVYDRHSYDPEKRGALSRWNALLDRVLRGEVRRNVFTLSVGT